MLLHVLARHTRLHLSGFIISNLALQIRVYHVIFYSSCAKTQGSKKGTLMCVCQSIQSAIHHSVMALRSCSCNGRQFWLRAARGIPDGRDSKQPSGVPHVQIRNFIESPQTGFRQVYLDSNVHHLRILLECVELHLNFSFLLTETSQSTFKHWSAHINHLSRCHCCLVRVFLNKLNSNLAWLQTLRVLNFELKVHWRFEHLPNSSSGYTALVEGDWLFTFENALEPAVMWEKENCFWAETTSGATSSV